MNNIEVVINYPGTDPYQAPSVKTVVLRGEYDIAQNVYSFKAQIEPLEDLVRIARAAGAQVYIKRVEGQQKVAPPPTAKTFQEAWEKYKAKGYQYGEDALEQVRFGYSIAMENQNPCCGRTVIERCKGCPYA